MLLRNGWLITKMFGNLSPSKVFKTYISMFEFLEFDPLNASVYAKQHV